MDERTHKILQTLKRLYPNTRPFLNFRTPFELLVATILSAQCTDVRVNIVTPALFRAANTPEKILKLGPAKLESLIKSTGFYRAKTKSILGASKKILATYHGKVPDTLKELMALPGVGRKTASAILTWAFGIPAMPVDRHVLRVANRLGLSKAKTPDSTADQLEKNIPKKYWISAHYQLVTHGRSLCRPKPKCNICDLLRYCPEGQRRKKAG